MQLRALAATKNTLVDRALKVRMGAKSGTWRSFGMDVTSVCTYVRCIYAYRPNSAWNGSGVHLVLRLEFIMGVGWYILK